VGKAISLNRGKKHAFEAEAEPTSGGIKRENLKHERK